MSKSNKTKCEYCGEMINIYMAMSEGKFCSLNCFEKFTKEEKEIETDKFELRTLSDKGL